MVDPGRLTQCFLNVNLNGLQAMENGGGPTISSYIRDGSFTVDIKDSGSGISVDDLTKIFYPYFYHQDEGHPTWVGNRSKINEQ